MKASIRLSSGEIPPVRFAFFKPFGIPQQGGSIGENGPWMFVLVYRPFVHGPTLIVCGQRTALNLHSVPALPLLAKYRVALV
jgi:hypothetical protein